MNPAIAIPAFSRPASLQRLLDAIAAADIPHGTPLLISVDRTQEPRHREGNAAVRDLVNRFRWPHGPLEVVFQPEPLGLVGNVFYCGAAALTFGAAVVLEDDLIVSARFHAYACRALDACGDDPRLAGISLNSPWFNGFTRQPFIPLLDDGDVFFLQLSTPQGQVYTAAQWAAFAGWLATATSATGATLVHDMFASFPPDDWLGTKARYLADTNRYYVYPRESLTTASGDAGTHFSRATAFFQAPLQGRRRDFRFLPFDEAAAVYDSFYELRPDRLDRLTDRLGSYVYNIDLYATKPERQLRADTVLTTRPCRHPLLSFGRAQQPLEANVIAGTPGRGICLARREDVDMGPLATRAARYANDRYFARYDRPGRFNRLAGALANRLYYGRM